MKRRPDLTNMPAMRLVTVAVGIILLALLVVVSASSSQPAQARAPLASPGDISSERQDGPGSGEMTDKAVPPVKQVDGSLPPPCASSIGTWAATPFLHTARSRLGVAYFPANGKFYAVGGEALLGWANPIEEYNPLTNSWVNRAMLTVGVSNSGAAAVGNYIYVPGGYDGTTARNVLQRFDPVANTVVLRAAMPTAKYGHAVVAQGNKVYALGGSGTGGEGTTNYIYDTATNVWSFGAPLPTAVEYAAAASDGTYIYLIGGRTNAITDLAVVQRYDPANNTWSGMPSLTTPRGGPAAFYDGLRIWAVNGGWSGGLASTEYFIPGSGAWIPGPSTLVAARTLGAAFSPELNLAVKAGGYMADYSQDAERLPFTAPIAFSDVHPGDFFYQSVANLYCRGVISGYADNTFRPFNDTTRAQLAKIIVLAERWALHVPVTPTFSDVPTTNPFYGYVETAVYRGVISGYGDGTFRPGNNVTRGQLSKIVVLAEGWPLFNPPTPTFSDVPISSVFYQYIETAFRHAIISGYGDGTFRPGNSATRGQICKIVYGAVTQP